MASAANVLPIFPAPNGNLWRKAVAQVIRQVKARHSLTTVDLADRIGCDASTVENAEAERNELRGATVARIGFEFGEDAIEPILTLWRKRIAEPRPPAIVRVRKAQEELSAALADLEREGGQ